MQEIYDDFISSGGYFCFFFFFKILPLLHFRLYDVVVSLGVHFFLFVIQLKT